MLFVAVCVFFAGKRRELSWLVLCASFCCGCGLFSFLYFYYYYIIRIIITEISNGARWYVRMRDVYLSSAVFVLMAITHSSPQDFRTVHCEAKREKISQHYNT